jgi:ribosome-binding protein aMBF1 (putative translation factor)
MSQITEFTAPSGDEMVIMPKATYDRLREAASMADDINAYDTAKAARDAGEDLIPHDVVKRLAMGESAVKVWREYRCIAQNSLANQLGINQSQLSRMESTPDGLKNLHMAARIADLLHIDLDDLVPE